MAAHQPAVLTRARRLFWAALAFTSVAVEFHGGPEFYFTYFTILTNLAIGAWFTAAALVPRVDRGSTVRLALTVYGLVTLTVYWILLSPTHHPTGASFFANLGLHLVVPLAMALEDLLVPWPRLNRLAPLWTMLWPLAYCALSLVRGAYTGWYPYFFLNPKELGGWVPLAVYVVVLVAVFVALAFGWRTVVHRRHGRANTAAE